MTALLLALAAGAVIGLAVGALGGGGGVLAVPALTYLVGVAPNDAATASLVIVSVTSLTALCTHARAGAVRWRTGLVFASAGLLPAVAASVVSRQLPHAVLTAAFAVLAGLAAITMLRGESPAVHRAARRWPSARVPGSAR